MCEQQLSAIDLLIVNWLSKLQGTAREIGGRRTVFRQDFQVFWERGDGHPTREHQTHHE